MKIFLVGLPGSGKSTLGPQLANRLGIPFVDLDFVIAYREGQDLPTIFRTLGTEYFRHSEHGCLADWCKTEGPWVMATGGGTPCFLNNMHLIKNAGISFFLDTLPSTILNRLEASQNLPLPFRAPSGGGISLQKIEALRSERIRFYSLANYTLTEPHISLETILGCL